MVHGCGICGRSFGSMQALHQHQRDSPFHAITHDCETCDRSFYSEQALYQHDRDSHPTTYDCEIRNQTFYSEHSLYQHDRDSHPDNYDCECCDSLMAMVRRSTRSPSTAKDVTPRYPTKMLCTNTRAIPLLALPCSRKKFTTNHSLVEKTQLNTTTRTTAKQVLQVMSSCVLS